MIASVNVFMIYSVSVTIGQYIYLFVWATVVGIGISYVWSTIGGSRSVRGLWHVGHSGARAVAMVITALTVSPI